MSGAVVVVPQNIAFPVVKHFLVGLKGFRCSRTTSRRKPVNMTARLLNLAGVMGFFAN